MDRPRDYCKRSRSEKERQIPVLYHLHGESKI